MRRFVSFVAVGALAFIVTAASAQSGDGCVLSGSSQIGDGGIPASATPVATSGPLKFQFSGMLGPCATGTGEGGSACAAGTVDGSCQGNTHEADYVVCTGACTADLNTRAVACTSGEQIAGGTLQGACIGSNCTGGDAEAPGGVYSLFFDAETVQAAVEECSSEGAITSASFDGVLVAGSPQ